MTAAKAYALGEHRMSTARHNRTTVFFFWIGVAMSVSCVLVVLARDTSMIFPFEQKNPPLSGVLAAIAALAFLATELSDSLSGPSQTPDRTPEIVLPMNIEQNDKVTKQKFLALMEAEFDRLDKDKNGTLDAEELSRVLHSTRQNSRS
jgi:hypothetical protein